MTKLLITGANGFIGNYFINKYQTNYNVSTFSFLKDDFESLDCHEVDTVVHLSALVHQMNGASAEDYERINLHQTLALAKKAKEHGVKHFVFMSTIKVYGEETTIPYNESSICVPEDDYGKSKLKAELALQALASDDFIISIIRTPIVYGVGVKANIKNLIQLIEKIPVLPFKNAHNKRSMVYIGNLSHLINSIIQQQASGIFLASDDTPISTIELIRLIAKALNKRTIIINLPFFEQILKLVKPSFHKRLFESLQVDNTLTKDRLRLKNPYTTEEGIYIMVQGELK